MKKNKRVTLSDKAFFKYYDHHGFLSLFASSLIQLKSSIFKETLISLGFALIGYFAIDIMFIEKPREFISVVCSGLRNYTITVIGFLLFSFTMLMVLISSKSIFKYFALEDPKYKKPIIKILLGAFIVPVGIFIFLFIFSTVISFLLHVSAIYYLTFECKQLFFRLFASVALFLFVFSILEFFSFFYNIYIFIVKSSYDMASEYEQRIIKTTVLHQTHHDDDIEKNN